MVLQFLQETSILKITNFALFGGDFIQIELENSDKMLIDAALIDSHFENGSFKTVTFYV